MPIQGKYWFPAKRYGWGWGLPATWQGWLVLAVFGVLIVVGVVLFPPTTERNLFVGYVVELSTVLVIVCWITGEPPRWRWGRDD